MADFPCQARLVPARLVLFTTKARRHQGTKERQIKTRGRVRLMRVGGWGPVWRQSLARETGEPTLSGVGGETPRTPLTAAVGRGGLLIFFYWSCSLRFHRPLTGSARLGSFGAVGHDRLERASITDEYRNRRDDQSPNPGNPTRELGDANRSSRAEVETGVATATGSGSASSSFTVAVAAAATGAA
jgi:hypothetical protein